MTTKHIEAFAAYIADLRQTVEEYNNMEGESEAAYEAAQVCENMVVEIAPTFFDSFDEEKFRKACQPTSWTRKA